MASGKNGASLAYVAEALTAIAAQMAEGREVQRNILTVLNALLETSQTHTEMLADILGAAAQDTGPSPVAQALDALTMQVRRVDENQTVLIIRLSELPEVLGRQLEQSITDQTSVFSKKS
jgi:hypothetical protein